MAVWRLWLSADALVLGGGFLLFFGGAGLVLGAVAEALRPFAFHLGVTFAAPFVQRIIAPQVFALRLGVVAGLHHSPGGNAANEEQHREGDGRKES